MPAECGAPLRQCSISLPDGSCCSVPLRAGVSIRDLLLGLCEKLCINLAAIDLFLVGGEKVEHTFFMIDQLVFPRMCPQKLASKLRLKMSYRLNCQNIINISNTLFRLAQ